MLEWKDYGTINPSMDHIKSFYLGRIIEMHLEHGRVKFVDGSDQAFSESVTPEQAKQLLREAIALIDKHCMNQEGTANG